MFPDQIVVSVLPADRRAAWLRGGRLIRFFHQGAPAALAHGDIVLGRIRTLAPALGIAFVDLGAGADAGVLALGDSRVPAGRPRDGDAVMVQLARAPTAGKGARLTRRVEIAGRCLILRPRGSGIAPSPGLALAEGAEGLRDRAGTLLPATHGWLLRPSAAFATDEALATEAADLVARWQALSATARAARPPVRLLAALDPVLAAVRDGLNPSLARIVSDDAAFLAELRRSVPAAAPLLRFHQGATPLFEATAINEQLDAALSATVPLPSGGRVTIAETEAVVAIDVDAGAAAHGDARTTALAVNLEAAAAIAVAIVLRELAGHIVVDFVPMRGRGARARVLAALRAGLAADDRQTDVAGFTALGLVEIRRASTGPSLRERLRVACAACAGTGRTTAPAVAAGDGLRALVAAALAQPHRRPTLVAAPDVIDALGGPLAAARDGCAARLGWPVAVRTDSTLAAGSFRLDLDAIRE